MSRLTYNGVTIDFIKTQIFEQTVEYDPTNTDYLYTKVKIRVAGVINPSVIPAAANERPNATINRIRKCLLAPRQKLLFGILGGDGSAGNIITSPALGENVDANNGPKPIALNLTQITTETILVTYEIETYLPECCTNQNLPYSSNRWSETHDIDAEGYVTRTIEGICIFKSNKVDSKVNPGMTNLPNVDHWRGLIAPPHFQMLDGFIRVSRKFTASEDGLGLKYTIVDKQQYTMLNDFVTRFEGRRQGEWKAQGGFFKEKLSLRAWAPPSVPKATVMAALVDIAPSLIDHGIVLTGESIDHIHENYCEINFTVLIAKKDKNKLGRFRVVFDNDPPKMTGLAGKQVLVQVPTSERGSQVNLNMLGLKSYLGMCLPPAPLTEMILKG